MQGIYILCSVKSDSDAYPLAIKSTNDYATITNQYNSCFSID